MTDNEIIKALECCADSQHCWLCVLRDKEDDCHNLEKYALDRINRLQAEIEELKTAMNCYRSYEEEQKADAIKEFAERLKDICKKRQYVITEKTNFGVINKQYLQVVDKSDIDNLVKEMVGEQ